jgi:ABC-type polysaccharide/polyol phosphate export permease
MSLKHWDLIKHLALREIRARYKQSFLGFFWVILNPFFQMLIMSAVFSQIIRVEDLGVPYPIYLYAGLLPWIFLSNSLSNGVTILVDNAPLLKKIYFPREIFVLSVLVAKAFDFFLAALIFVLLMIWFHVPLQWHMLLFFPIFIIQFIFVFGLTLLLSALNLFYRDVQFLFNLILTLWFYVTPVIYAVEFFPESYRWFFKLNPMSVFINAYREVLLSNGSLNGGSIVLGIVFSLAMFVISYRIFKKLEGMFADVV